MTTRLCFFDIEASNLNANFGYMLSFGWKFQDEKSAKVISIADYPLFEKDPTNDKRLVKDAAEILNGADIVCGHYSCPTPDQRVLTADLRWVPAGDLRVGDRLIGFDAKADQGKRRYWRESQVTHVGERLAAVYRVVFEDDTEVLVSGEHPWLTLRGTHYNWVSTSRLTAGATHSKIYRFFSPWQQEQSWAGGYIAGFFDSEGTLGQSERSTTCWGAPATSRPRFGLQIAASQNENIVLSTITDLLKQFGVSYKLYHYDPANRKCVRVQIQGELPDRLAFLGRFRPVRLQSRLDLGKLSSMKTFSRPCLRVRRVVPEGVRPITELSTSTETYMLEGFGAHNSRFDTPYIQTRLMYHGLKPMAPTAHIDTWRICKYKLKLNSNRLDTISKFLNVKYEKTPIDFRHWIKAMAGNKASLKYIVQHNRYDVLVLEEVYNRIRVLCPTHPNMNILSAYQTACPTCGVDGKLQKRGWNIAKTTKSQRYQCMDCGGWSKGRPERIENLEVR